jgi:predicted RNA binding protein YcfA (HicA-like mRNA interferase family)
MKVRDVIKLLQQDGWFLDHTRGSHRQYKRPSKPGLVTLPGKLATIWRREPSIAC